MLAVLDHSSRKLATTSKLAKTVKAFIDEFAISDPWHFLIPPVKRIPFSHMFTTPSLN